MEPLQSIHNIKCLEFFTMEIQIDYLKNKNIRNRKKYGFYNAVSIYDIL